MASGASAYFQKAMLDWVFGGANPANPAAGCWAALAYAAPGSRSDQGSEFGTLTGYSRVTALFNAASSATLGSSASASNSAAMTFGPFSSVGSAIGITIWDHSAVGSSDMMWYGTFVANRTFSVNDYLIVAAGALTLTLS